MSSFRKVFFLINFFSIRLIFLTSLPIFNDESIQFHWGNFFIQNLENLQKVPLTQDGKQTGVPFVFGLVQFLPFDPLISGRVVSVFFSLVTFASAMAIARKMHVSLLLVGLLLTFCPYLLFFDRLALSESIITACYTLSLLILILFSEKPSVKKGILLGSIISMGWWFKSTILLIVPTMVMVGIVSFFRHHARWRVASSITMSFLIFFLLTGPLLFHEKYQNSPQKDTLRILRLEELISTSPLTWVSKLSTLTQWFFDGLTPLVFIAFIFGFWISFRKNRNTFLLAAIFFPIGFELLFLRTITSRYLVQIVPVMLIVSVFGISSCAQRIQHGYRFIMIAICIGFSLTLILSPLSYYRLFLFLPDTRSDFAQYFTGWPSGYGVKEAVDWIVQQSGGEMTAVLVRRDSGNPEDAMYVYLNRQDAIFVAPADAYDRLRQDGYNRFLFVSRGPQYAGLEKSLKEVVRFNKPLDDEFVGVFEVQR